MISPDSPELSSKSRTLWFIPARGGSKGIPDKNIKPFCGKPLVVRAVKQALACAEDLDTIFVSTDSIKIKEAAESCGIKIPFLRPPHLSTDSSSTYSALIHALEEFKARNITFEKLVLLQPTSPLRTVSDIEGAMKLWNPGIDMVVSVCEAKANPYYNAFEADHEGFLRISKGDGKITRRQDAPHVWEYNGAVYVITVDSLFKGPFSTFKKIVPYPMSPSKSLDLDTPEDWTIAEILFSRLNN